MPHRSVPRRFPTCLALLAAVAFTLAGCAATGARLADAHRTPLGEPLDPLWAELPEVYRDLGLTIAELPIREPEIRTVDMPLDGRSPSRVSHGRIATCPHDEGAARPAGEPNAFFRVRTWLESDGAAADVVTRLDAWQMTNEGRRRSCRSTGVLERRIADELRSRV